MIEQGALEVISALSECGSAKARQSCATAMSKLSSSVTHLRAGTVSSLIALCMGPQQSAGEDLHTHSASGDLVLSSLLPEEMGFGMDVLPEPWLLPEGTT